MLNEHPILVSSKMFIIVVVATVNKIDEQQMKT